MKSLSPYLLLTSLFISDIGLGITQMYTMIWVYEETGSYFFLSLHSCILFGASAAGGFFYTLPLFRTNLLKLMLVSKFLMMIALITLAWHLNLFSLYLLLALFYISSSIFIPSSQAALAILVPFEQLKQWNTGYYMSYSLSLCLGWVIGPILFPFLNYSGVIAVDAGLTLVCLLLLLGIYKANPNNRSSQPESHNKLGSTKRKQGSLEVNITLILFSFGCASLIFSAINAVEMGLFAEIYQINSQTIGLFFISWAIGGALTGLINCIKKTECLFGIYVGALYLFPLCTCALLISNQVAINILIYGLCGFLYGLSQVLSNSFIYTCCEPERYALTFNKKNVIANVVFLLSSPVIGLSADKFSATAIMLGACSIALIILFLLLRFPPSKENSTLNNRKEDYGQAP